LHSFLPSSCLFSLPLIPFWSLWFLCSVGISLHYLSKFLFPWGTFDKYRSNLPIQETNHTYRPWRLPR
jgi:hypothetical protein